MGARGSREGRHDKDAAIDGWNRRRGHARVDSHARDDVVPAVDRCSGQEEQDPFQPFKLQTGTVLTIKGPACTAPDNGANDANVCTLDVNPFFSEDFSTNGQECATCC